MAFLDYESKRGSGKKLKVHFDLPDDDDYPNSSWRYSTSVASDSSLDSDDTENGDDENGSDNFEPKYDNNDNLYGSPVCSFQSGIPQSPPPIQMMSPNNGYAYDPNRIPSSVFARSAQSPIEWSLASNESLFSLHLGNASFSLDNAFGFGNKSGELAMMSDFGSMPLPPSPVRELNRHDENVDTERPASPPDKSEESAHKIGEASAQVETNVPDRTPEDRSTEATIPDDDAKSFASISCRSEAIIRSEAVKSYASASYRSVESDRSFQFPILIADGRRSSSAAGRCSSVRVESVKPEKVEIQQQSDKPEKAEIQQPDMVLSPLTPEVKNKAPKPGYKGIAHILDNARGKSCISLEAGTRSFTARRWCKFLRSK